MTSSSEIPTDKGPSVGEKVNMAVVPSPTRTTIFPETTVVLMAEPDKVELVFLRREVAIISQIGEVTRNSEGTFDVEVKDTAVAAQIHDIGHARLKVGPAIDLARLIIHHIAEHHGHDLDELLATVARKE
ncbi:hypothetical protein [Brevundimonas sp.]|uniref:hypothetical protein n=1 Tax=Brevundimonas sp. TaxID=1871086 RepID=UPI0012228CD2|nr:hypothetical protein [Brevundimonas sp.]TAJ67411.1 MAG: hypothetical protein EPO49_00670 [Brevundimonas sp.]